MNCWRIQNTVVPFLEGELPDEEERAFADHIERCPACSRLVEGVASLPELHPVQLDDGLQEALWGEFDNKLRQRINDSVLGGGPPAAEPAAWSRRGANVQVPTALAAAYLLGMLLLAGMSFHTSQKVDRLEAALSHKDQTISVLQDHIVRNLPETIEPLNGSFATPASTVLLPATASSNGLPVMLPGGSRGTRLQLGGLGMTAPRYSRHNLAWDGPRVTH